MARKKKNKSRVKEIIAASKAQRALDRKRHFADGGSVEEWNGSKAIHSNKADKRKSRRTRRKSAINESQEG